MSGPVYTTSTNVTYTPTWQFDQPWVLATGQFVTPVTLLLDANLTSFILPAPTAIIFNGTSGETMYLKPPKRASPGFSSTEAATMSSETATTSAFTTPVMSSGVISPNFTSTSRIPTSTPSSTIDAPEISSSHVQTTSPSSGDNSGLSLGQTVGIAIGCIFVGAAFAALAACFLNRRSRRSGNLPSERSGSKSSISEKLIDGKSPPIIMENIERPPPYMRLEKLLARPSSEDELLSMFIQINTSISEYVQRYTSPDLRSQLPATETTSARMLGELLGSESPIGVNRIFASLQNDQTRAASLRHLIACSILQNIRSSGAPETTLLPPEISECMSSMTGMRGDVNGMAAY